MNRYVQKYIDFVDFLADFLGEDTEIVLHDMTDLESSVVAIRNGHISGRKIGAPATDLVLKIIKNEKASDQNFLANYRGTSKSGAVLKSATYFIRDDEGQIVGTICINMNIDKLMQVRKHLDKFIGFDENLERTNVVSENLSLSAAELTLDSINKVILALDIPPARMNQNEKLKIVNELNEMGIFLIKGAVSQVASKLKASEATIYRYLGKLKKNEIDQKKLKKLQ